MQSSHLHYGDSAYSELPTTGANYNPDALLNELQQRLGLKNDAALSRALEVAPPVISKIRHRRLPVGASLLIRMHEVSDISIRDLRNLMGDRRARFRMSDKSFRPENLNRDDESQRS
jgi:plasmid maintenance system antidote protein VapI